VSEPDDRTRQGITRRDIVGRGIALGGLLIPGTSLAALLSACESGRPVQETVRTSAQLPVNVPRDKTLVIDQIFRYSVTKNFNMYSPTTPTPVRHGLVMDTLWYIDQQTGQWINALASDKPVYNADFTQMTVPLRSGVAWSDGVAFSADDLVFTVQKLMASPGLIWSSDMQINVQNVVKRDDRTVVFTLKRPNPRFHLYFTAAYNGMYMMAKHVWEKAGDARTFAHFPPVSLGAYNFHDVDPNGYWELFKRRDDWRQTTAGMVAQSPGPDYVLTLFYGDDQHKVIAMKQHALDVLIDLNTEAFQTLRKGASSVSSWYNDFPWAYPNELNVRFFGFNWTRAPYDNRDVRWALALALDLVGLQTNYEGGVTRVTPFQVPAVPSLLGKYHLPLESWLQQLTIDVDGQAYRPYDADVPKRIGSWAKANGHNVSDSLPQLHQLFGIGWWKHAPDVAAKLLTKNGFKKDGSGRWQLPDGRPWTMTIIAAPDEADAYRLALGAQDQWKKFGIDVTVQSLERDPFNQRQYVGDFDVTSTWSSLAPTAIADLWQGLNLYSARYFAPIGQSTQAQGSNNWMRFRSPELDQVIERLTGTSPDNPASLDLSQQAVKIWTEQMLTLPTVSFKKFVTTDSTFWTGWPKSDHPDREPLYWFMGGRFAVQKVVPAK
jgi:peptide/nickel transport system substrate-binding protein